MTELRRHNQLAPQWIQILLFFELLHIKQCTVQVWSLAVFNKTSIHVEIDVGILAMLKSVLTNNMNEQRDVRRALMPSLWGYIAHGSWAVAEIELVTFNSPNTEEKVESPSNMQQSWRNLSSIDFMMKRERNRKKWIICDVGAHLIAARVTQSASRAFKQSLRAPESLKMNVLLSELDISSECV